MQLADVQIGNEGNKYPETEQYEMIDDLINRSDPDFIVLTGDNALYDDLEKLKTLQIFLIAIIFLFLSFLAITKMILNRRSEKLRLFLKKGKLPFQGRL